MLVAVMGIAVFVGTGVFVGVEAGALWHEIRKNKMMDRTVFFIGFLCVAVAYRRNLITLIITSDPPSRLPQPHQHTDFRLNPLDHALHFHIFVMKMQPQYTPNLSTRKQKEPPQLRADSFRQLPITTHCSLFLNPFFAAIANPTKVNNMLAKAKNHLIVVMAIVSHASAAG